MEFTWGWLGKGNKQKERDSSDEDKNRKHCRPSWSKVVKESSVALGNAAASTTCHSQPSVPVPVPRSPWKPTVNPTMLNPTGIYTGEQVHALLAEARKGNIGSSGEDKEGWIEHKSKSTIKKERNTESKTPKKRRFNSPINSNDCCWICEKRGRFKDKWPYMRCRFCKVLGHVIAECPTLHWKEEKEIKETRKVTTKTSRATARTTKNTLLQTRGSQRKQCSRHIGKRLPQKTSPP